MLAEKKLETLFYSWFLSMSIAIFTIYSNDATLKIIWSYLKTGFKSKFIELKALTDSLSNINFFAIGTGNVIFCAAMKLQ